MFEHEGSNVWGAKVVNEFVRAAPVMGKKKRTMELVKVENANHFVSSAFHRFCAIVHRSAPVRFTGRTQKGFSASSSNFVPAKPTLKRNTRGSRVCWIMLGVYVQ